ncbi:MAG: hypothetical protein HC875_33730, partial [Anaerolineales bacterium]|nr:hypothetical protein [Anaerolineales bacterium]
NVSEDGRDQVAGIRQVSDHAQQRAQESCQENKHGQAIARFCSIWANSFN